MSKARIPAQLTPVFGVVFLDLLGFGIVIPILPYYSKSFGASGFELGLLMASFSLFQLAFSPFWGHLSDRFGRKKILLLTVLGTAAGYGLVGAAQSWWMMLFGRSVAGMFSANLSAAQAMVSESTEGEVRARALGLVGAALGMGFLLGPPIGGALSHWGYGTPLFFASSLALLNALFIWKRVPDRHVSAPKQVARPSFRQALRTVTGDPTSLASIAIYFVFTLALTQMEVSFALSLLARFGMGALETGLLMAGMGVGMALMQTKGIRWARARWSQSQCIVRGLSLFGIGLLTLGLAPQPIWVWAGVLLAAGGQSLIQPNLSAAASGNLPPHHHGVAYGVYQSSGSLARILGPIAAGLTLQHARTETPFLSGALLLFALTLTWVFPVRAWNPTKLFSFKT